MTYAIATLRGASGPVPAIEVDGEFYDLESIAPDWLKNDYGVGLMALFKDWETSERRLSEIARDITSASPARVEKISFLTPLQYPRKLVLGGANYYEHMRRDAGKPDFRKEASMPVFFLKPPTTALVGCGRTVVYPRQSKMFDWEIELAVVIGRRIKRATEAQALAAIAGYAVGLDLSARDWQLNERHPWKFDLFTGKAFDTSCPVGPKIVPARFVDAGDIRLRLEVNGVVKQDAHSSDMIWSVAEQIAAVTEHLTLEPGDILLTGTPAGVGMATGQYLNVGDRITAEIEKLGRLEVEIVAEDTSP